MSQYKQHKKDGNHKEISDCLIALGATVQDLAPVGGGCPDILVGFGGVNYTMEIKEPNGKLTPAQWKWHDAWKGQKVIVESIDEVVEFLSAYHVPRKEFING